MVGSEYSGTLKLLIHELVGFYVQIMVTFVSGATDCSALVCHLTISCMESEGSGL